MQLLEEKIQNEGKALSGNIIKVDGFLNHRVDIKFMKEIAKEFHRIFGNPEGLTAIVTVEASGIAVATICAEEFGVPLIFAKKAKSDNIEGGLYQSEIISYTYKKKFNLILSKEWLGPDDKVIIIDDFLANGEALRGLIDIVHQSGAQLLGVGVCVEKGFQPGGQKLREQGVNLHSLAIIDSVDENGFHFRHEEA